MTLEEFFKRYRRHFNVSPADGEVECLLHANIYLNDVDWHGLTVEATMELVRAERLFATTLCDQMLADLEHVEHLK
jgi:hypothetical protein